MQRFLRVFHHGMLSVGFCAMALSATSQPSLATNEEQIIDAFLEVCTGDISDFSALPEKLKTLSWKSHDDVVPAVISKIITVDIDANDAFAHRSFERSISGQTLYVIINQTKQPSGALENNCDFIAPTLAHEASAKYLTTAIGSTPDNKIDHPREVAEQTWKNPSKFPTIVEIGFSFIRPNGTMEKVFGTSGVILGTRSVQKLKSETIAPDQKK